MNATNPNPNEKSPSPTPETQTPVPDDETINGTATRENGTWESADLEKPEPFDPTNPPASDYPDSGLRAWLVVLGTVCGTFATFGLVNSWGVFQSYYETTILQDSSPSDIAWIGSVQYAFIFFPGLICGRMFDLGYFRVPYFIATLILVATAFLTAECKEYWQFLLCQGFAQGISAGMIFGPSMGVIGHWFKERRGLALGITALGSSTGGTVFPIMARNLINIVGFKWTLRIMGFIILAVMAVANLVLRRRLPPKNVKGGLVNPRAFKSAAYTIYCIAGFAMFLGLYTLLTYIDVSATTIGISPDFSFYLVAIANAGSGFGRLAAGLLVDKFGSVNVIAPMCLVAALLTYVWPFVHTQGGLIAIAIIYGFASGTYVSTFVLPLFELGEIGDIGRRTGMMFTICAFGALGGPPISGAINRATGGYEGVGFYAGSMIVVGTVLMLATRQIVLKRFWGKF